MSDAHALAKRPPSTVFYRTKKIHAQARNLKPNDDILAVDEGTSELKPVYLVVVLDKYGKPTGEVYHLLRCHWVGLSHAVYDPEEEHPKLWIETSAKVFGTTATGEQLEIY